MTEENKLVILHIASPGRSGSTLLERVLNEVPGVFAAGEVGMVDDFDENRRCCCGEKVMACACWGCIAKEPDFARKINKDFFNTHKKYRRIIYFIKIFLLTKIHKVPKDFQIYLGDLRTWYSTVVKHQGCQVITDSTTLPFYGYYLSQIPSVDIYIVHLVRDPRGVIHSWNQVKLTPRSRTPWSKKIGIWQGTLSWLKRDWIAGFLFSKRPGKYLRIHYEDFIEDPIGNLEAIGKMLGLELKGNLNFIDGKKVKFREHHMIGANIDAFKRGEEEVMLKMDERWRQGMAKKHLWLVNLLTWPMRLKYALVDKSTSYLK